MLFRPVLSTLSLIAFTLFLAASPVDAQVTLNLTTTQQTDCVAVTDAQGLQLVPGGTDLQATGVTLSGTGCGGAGSSEFDAVVNVPASAVAGTAFNVSWSASADATQCTYGGSTGVTGWPIGQNACQATACGTAHVNAVTVPAAGNYAFNVTCTNASGFAQDSVAAIAPQLPPQPANFALTGPATATVGTPIQISWSVTGAQTCTGSASLNGSSVNLSGWTDNTSPTSPRAITLTQAGSYALLLTCSNVVGPTVSQTKIIVATAGGGTDNCPITPLTRLTVATIRYPNVPPSDARRTNVDVRLFENIWGHRTTTDTALGWPGRAGAVPGIIGWGKTQYVAAKFTVPVGVSGDVYETLSYSSYYSGPLLTMSVSSMCGDFTPSDPDCLTTGVGTGDAFKKLVIAPYANGCPLTPGATYFINMKMENPQPADCNNASSCTLATTNTLGEQ